ncbi:MAG: sigma-54-dependent Fis family transcriptional regulator, partial [Verrucomicrobia bacterium]|nr:sigma-54-dependent Fis family transcriptional regulator [Verrucomicrobiota bacterium]
QIAKQLYPEILVIILTSPLKIDKALSAIRLGAFQYIVQPLTEEALETTLQKAFEHTSLLQENAFLRKEISYSTKKESHPLIAESPVMKQIMEDICKIAKSNASVFIIGESGTGKEVLANAIHQNSFRSHKPFIRVNCAAVPESLLESEFFGHEKGAFTGAIQKRIGRFELANTGSLLLDEISEVPLELQPKLLRAIQEREFERVGGTKQVQVDVRIISTSNRNMKEAVEKKIFREDLFFRLHVVPIKIPPLRERKEDIIPLAEYFLEKFCKDNFLSPKKLSNEAKEKLLSYYWPGNIRELANLMERTIIMHVGEKILDKDLKLEFSCPIPPATKIQTLDVNGPKTLAAIEKTHILSTLEQLQNNKTKTAECLGISLRTLRNKLKEYQKTSSSYL